MSESGFPSFPSGPKVSESVRSNSGKVEFIAQLTDVPEAFQDTSRPVKVRGEVVQESRDPQSQVRTVRIRTDRGEVEVRVPPEQSVPPRGQEVELEVRPGNPPDRVVIRSAPVQVVQAAPQEVDPAESRPVSTPVNVDVGGAPVQAPSAVIEPFIVPEGQVLLPDLPDAGSAVRLTPISAQDLASVLLPVDPEAVVSSRLSVVEFQAQVFSLPASDPNLINYINLSPEDSDIKQFYSFNKIQNIPVLQASVLESTSSAPDVLLTPPPRFKLPALFRGAQQVQLSPVPYPAAPLPLSVIGSPVSEPLAVSIKLESSFPVLPQNLSLDVRIADVKSPQPEASFFKENGAPSILQDVKAGAMTGMVIGQTAEHLPILSLFMPQASEPQSFALQVPVENVVPGTRLQMVPLTGSVKGSVQSVSAAQFLTPGLWPVMQELQQVLTQSAPPLAQALSQVVPHAGNAPSQMGPAILFFVAAVRGGDMAGWLGDKTVDALRRDGRGNLLARLTSEGGLLGRIAAEPMSQDWRALALPMFWDGDMQKIALYYKHDHDGGEPDQHKTKQTRFVFDLNLSQMGKVQLDGLFRPGRLDLIVRTEDVFSQAMQMEMRQVYAKALKDTQVTGELSFQNQPEQWVTVKAEGEENRFSEQM